MKNYTVIFLGLLLTIPGIAQNQKRQTEHFKVDYYPEAEIYAIASSVILETAWTEATENGFYLPDRIKLTIKKSDRNALYFNRKSLKGIIWEFKNIAEFLPPEQGGKNCIYGLCHEIGHLCMYNTNHNRNSWMSLDYREGWADYFGNMMVDQIYDQLGTEIWPEPHDFRKFAGMEFFLQRMEKNQPELQSFNNAGQFWYELGSGIGFNHIQDLFNALDAEDVDNPEARQKYLKVLEGFVEKKDVETWFEQYSDLIMNRDS